MHCGGDAFTAEQKARNFAYYEALTVRDSSLSACTQAVIAAEVGHLELAYDYLARGRADGPATTSSTTPATACTSPRWRAPGSPPSRALAGMRDHEDRLTLSPRLPDALTRLVFSFRHQNRRVRVEFDHRQAVYTLVGWRATRAQALRGCDHDRHRCPRHPPHPSGSGARRAPEAASGEGPGVAPIPGALALALELTRRSPAPRSARPPARRRA